jgi:hypothetical protein
VALAMAKLCTLLRLYSSCGTSLLRSRSAAACQTGIRCGPLAAHARVVRLRTPPRLSATRRQPSPQLRPTRAAPHETHTRQTQPRARASSRPRQPPRWAAPHAATPLPPERPTASPQACACALRASARPGDAAARLAQPPARYAARKGALWGHAHRCALGVRAAAYCGAVDDHVCDVTQRPGQCAHRPHAALVARRLGGACAVLSGAARAAQAARCCCTVLRRIDGACRCAGVGVVCTRATRANAGADSPHLQMTLHLLNTTDPLAVCNE